MSWKIVLSNIVLIILLPLILIKLLIMPFTVIDKLGNIYLPMLIVAIIALLVIWCVLFIKTKENLPYWIKGTAIGSGLYLLLLSIESVPEFIACESVRHSSNGLGMCGLFTAMAMIFLLILIPLGAIIGFIIGKIKQQKINIK